MLSYLGRNLPASLLWEIVDLQLFLVFAEYRVSTRRQNVILLFRLVVELVVQLCSQLLRNRFRLKQ